MDVIKLLVVEDEPSDLDLCRRAIRRYNEKPGQELDVEIFENVDEAMLAVDKSFDGALIDLRIDGEDDAGNRVIREIEKHEMCIPVIILTGTPGRAETELSYVEVREKAAQGSSYDDLLARFKSIHETGITKILGGRGEMERRLGEVFRRQIAPQLDQWERYGANNAERTEKALLRHVMYNLVQLIDEDAEFSFPEEFYLYPSSNKHLRTGAVIDRPSSERRCVVLSPDCDLVVRNGERKTDRILLGEIVVPNELFPNYDAENDEELKSKR